MSKTLDQASAQFAASALVTTDQLMAFKAKEEVVLGSGVNGVLPGSGEQHFAVLPSGLPTNKMKGLNKV